MPTDEFVNIAETGTTPAENCDQPDAKPGWKNAMHKHHKLDRTDFDTNLHVKPALSRRKN